MVELLAVAAAALLLGAAITWLILRASTAAAEGRAAVVAESLARAEREIEDLRTELATALHDKTVAETRVEEAGDAFKAIASQALDESTARLLKLAEERFQRLQAEAAGELRSRTDAIGQVIAPLAEKLTEYQRKTEEFAQASERSFGSVGQQLREVVAAADMLKQETNKLVNALRTPHVRGRWGEVALRRVAELSGMSPHLDFLEQSTHTGEDGRLRPDVIVKLPAGRTIIVDAKVALSAYLDALEAPTEEERRQHLQRHAQQLRTHVGKLADRGYAAQFRESAEFVVLFIPGDTFLAAAAEADPNLIEQALEKHVVIATPSTLIALLRAVAFGWRQEKLAENAQRISELGRDLHSRMAVLVTRLAETGQRLGKTVDAYNRTVGSLEARVLPAVRRFDDLGVPSTKERIDPAPIDLQVRQPGLLEIELE